MAINNPGFPNRSGEPAAGARSFDQKILASIEEARRKHARFRDIKVRAEADVERLGAEHAAALADIQERFGVADVDQLRLIVVARRAEISAQTEAYVEQVAGVEDALRALGELA